MSDTDQRAANDRRRQRERGKSQPSVVILGAGPAGICAALPLGTDALIIEQREDIGGLSCSFEFHGAILDMGGHSFHSPHAEVRNLVFNSLDMYEQKRDARCYAHGSMISYPFQKHFRELSHQKIVDDCDRGLRDVNEASDSSNLEVYLHGRFGAGIAEHFLVPYNRKQWRADLRHISTDWVGERIAAPLGRNESFETNGGSRKPLQDDTAVAYPARGGFGEIAKALARRVSNLRLGTTVKRVDPLGRKIVTTAGDVLPWRRLISTLPINLLLGMTEHVPEAVRGDVSRLAQISLKLIFIVIGCPVRTSIQRIYTADADMPAHKIVVANNSSDYLRSLPCHGISGEIAYTPERFLQSAPLEQQFAASLLKLGLIQNSREIVAISSTDIRYAYPVPTIDRSAIVSRAKAWLEEHGIHTIGRFGEWAYINSDEAMFRGLRVGQQLAGEL